MSFLVDALLTLPPWLVLTLVFSLPAAEASLFAGLVVPGETAVLIGGVIAHGGSLSLAAVIGAASLGAVVGDEIGYLVGRHYGERLLRRLPARVSRSGHLSRALAMIGRHGAFAVALGRWAAAFRALVPGLAGMAGITQVRFTVANVTSGVAWAATMAVLGYLAGAAFRTIESRVGLAGDVLAAAIVVVSLGWFLWSRRRVDPASERL